MSVKGLLPDEISTKAIAECFWHKEVDEELLDNGIRWYSTLTRKCFKINFNQNIFSL